MDNLCIFIPVLKNFSHLRKIYTKIFCRIKYSYYLCVKFTQSLFYTYYNIKHETMSKNNSSGPGFLFMLYILISQIMTAVFFIEYCRSDDSLLEIIFIDTILAELKGLLWFLFVF